MQRLIGITGRAGSGKGVCSDLLVSEYGFIRIKFADPLKSMLRALGLTDRHIEGDLKELPCDLLGGRSPRYAMLTLGTEWGRNLMAAQMWVNVWKSRVSAAMRAGQSVVVDDCRFPNEAEAIARLGGKLYRVVRPATRICIAHDSEDHIDALPAGGTIINDASIGLLQSRLERFALGRE